MKSLKIDIMIGDRFFHTLRYPCKPHPVIAGGEMVNIDLNEEDVRKYVESKFPSLRGKQYSIKI